MERFAKHYFKNKKPASFNLTQNIFFERPESDAQGFIFDKQLQNTHKMV